ncbi:MAG: helix-turn-helix transcriptional regulator [Clostridia bacterium]|nr:helix-turn-helix transcriptional regulator [Clostridia bacterium]MDE7348896.1 helix-turn-helix transcriptional regulator [Clostridia bacterium]
MLNYGESFREQREAKGLSRLELSKQIGTSHQNISRWESNKVQPNLDFCVKLADFYGISLDELVGRDFIPNGQAKNQQ